MNKSHVIVLGSILVLGIIAGLLYSKVPKFRDTQNILNANTTPAPNANNPLSIDALKQTSFPGSSITIEQTLAPGSNYQRYLASYKSEGLKIYALLTVPDGTAPTNGWPVIVFNHGYIPPKTYSPTERYIAYTDAFSRNGYIVFRPDYRGNGNSEGQAVGAYGSNAYTIDVLNAVASIKKYSTANPSKIGMWGHSMGGFITLRALVVSHDIKAAVIWGGVVASYADLFTKWHPQTTPRPEFRTGGSGNPPGWRNALVARYGSPDKNPVFWNSISANGHLADITAPIQLDHSITDEEVPVVFSETLESELKAAGKSVELFTYPGDDHNISGHLSLALQRSVDFFDMYLKGGEKNNETK